MMKRILIMTVVAIAVSSCAAQTFTGVASVVDGDTIEIHGQRIRIHGIDAPEGRQFCFDADGEQYRCGQAAAFALDDFLKASRPTTCEQTDKDLYGRIVARCHAAGKDVAEWMVGEGHALDWPRYSKGEYAAAEQRAKTSSKGIWQGTVGHLEIPRH